MKPCKRKVLKHLKADSKTWGKIANIAREEKLSDLRLIKKLRRLA
jgi:hypothetical protein